MRRGLVDQPGAKRALRHGLQDGDELPSGRRGGQTGRNRQACPPVVGNQTRDPKPPPRLQESLELGGGALGNGRQGSASLDRGGRLQVGGATVIRGDRAREEPDDDPESRASELAKSDLDRWAHRSTSN